MSAHNDEYAVAVHEAAHAVLMLLFGYPFSRVTIKPTRGARGHVRTARPLMMKFLNANSATLRRAIERMMILCAGDLAKRRYTGDVSIELKYSDNPTHDGTQLLGLLSPLGDDYGLCLAIVLHGTAALLGLPHVWQAIRVISNLLLERTTLSFAETEAAFQSVIAPEDRREEMAVVYAVEGAFREAVQETVEAKNQRLAEAENAK